MTEVMLFKSPRRLHGIMPADLFLDVSDTMAQ